MPVQLRNDALCSVADVRRWGIFDPGLAVTELDDAIADAINVATDRILHVIGGPVYPTTYTLERYSGRGSSVLYLRVGPIISVSTVQIQSGDTTETVDSSSYRLSELYATLTRIGAVWPVGRGNIAVTYVAGYAVVPPAIRRACARLSLSMAMDRGRDPRVVRESGPNMLVDRSGVDIMTGLPVDVLDMLRPYRWTKIAEAGVLEETT